MAGLIWCSILSTSVATICSGMPKCSKNSVRMRCFLFEKIAISLPFCVSPMAIAEQLQQTVEHARARGRRVAQDCVPHHM